MERRVHQLLADSGAMLEVTGRVVVAERYAALALRFEQGTLRLACDDDTDEIQVDVLAARQLTHRLSALSSPSSSA